MLMVGLLECMPVHHVDTVGLGNPEEGFRSLGTGVRAGYLLTLGPLEE